MENKKKEQLLMNLFNIVEPYYETNIIMAYEESDKTISPLLVSSKEFLQVKKEIRGFTENHMVENSATPIFVKEQLDTLMQAVELGEPIATKSVKVQPDYEVILPEHPLLKLLNKK